MAVHDKIIIEKTGTSNSISFDEIKDATFAAMRAEVRFRKKVDWVPIDFKFSDATENARNLYAMAVAIAAKGSENDYSSQLADRETTVRDAYKKVLTSDSNQEPDSAMAPEGADKLIEAVREAARAAVLSPKRSPA